MGTFYVSTGSGADTNAGTSIGAPVKTINKAITLLTDGVDDIVYIMSGNYYERCDFMFQGGGSVTPASHRVTIKTYGDGVVTIQSPETSGVPATLRTGDQTNIQADLDLIIKPPNKASSGTPTYAHYHGYATVADYADYILNVTGVIYRGNIKAIDGEAGPDEFPSMVAGAPTVGLYSYGVVNLRRCVFWNLSPKHDEGAFFFNRTTDTSCAHGTTSTMTASIDSCLWFRCGATSSVEINNQEPSMVKMSSLAMAMVFRNNTITQCTGTWMLETVGVGHHGLFYNNLIYDNAISSSTVAGSSTIKGGGLDLYKNLRYFTASCNNIYNPNVINHNSSHLYNYYIYEQGTSFVPPNNFSIAVTNHKTPVSHSVDGIMANKAQAHKSYAESEANLKYFSGYSTNGSTYPNTLPPSIPLPVIPYPGKMWGDVSHMKTNMILGTSSFSGENPSGIGWLFEVNVGGSYTLTGSTGGGTTAAHPGLSSTDLLNHSRSFELTGSEQSCVLGCFEPIYQFGLPPETDNIKNILPSNPNTLESGPMSNTSNTHNKTSHEYPRNVRQLPYSSNIKGPPSLRNRAAAYTVDVTPDKRK
jgi:hypothetical protein